MNRILFVCNTAGIAANFREPLLKGAIAKGWSVSLICGLGADAENCVKRLIDMCVDVHLVPGLEAASFSPIQLAREAREIRSVIMSIRPKIVHSFTHRANVATFLGLPGKTDVRFFPNVTGAGRLFESEASLEIRVARRLLLLVYRLMSSRCEVAYFQNETDAEEIGGAMGLPSERIEVTGGSGLDPSSLTILNESDIVGIRDALEREFGIDASKRLVLLPARALRSKGIGEFYAAASRYLELFDDAVFVHAGEAVESSDSGFGRRALQSMERPGLRYVGFRTDILDLMAVASAIVLPTYYREGTPRSLIEALFLGKLIITTNMPGCRETVIDGWNGLLVNVRSRDSILAALVASRGFDLEQVALNSRLLFDRRYHSDRVVETYMARYASCI